MGWIILDIFRVEYITNCFSLAESRGMGALATMSSAVWELGGLTS